MPNLLNTRIKTAFVTGASSGIGMAIVEMLLAEGVLVWGTSRTEARLASLVEKYPGRFMPVVLDLAQAAAAEEAFARAAIEATTRTADGQSAGQEPATFDLVVNNAGYGYFEPFADADFAVWQAQYDMMITATARLTHAALRGMRARDRGTIVNVASLAVEFPLPYMSGYNVTKAALSALSESLIFECRHSGVSIIDFRPGDYRTAFNEVIQTSSPLRQTLSQPSATHGRIAAAWKALEDNLHAAPPPEHAARALRRALMRGRSGTVRAGSFFQAYFAPFGVRMLPACLRRAIIARYFGAP